MYRQVLLAYDGSAEGRGALREGALLAKQCSAEVFLLSVIPESAGMLLSESTHAGVLSQQEERFQAIFDEGIQKLRELGYLPRGKLVAGDPARQIATVAKSIGADLVVVGHRRRSAFERWWSGSSGLFLVDILDCSLLVGRHNITEAAFEAAVQALDAKGQS